MEGLGGDRPQGSLSQRHAVGFLGCPGPCTEGSVPYSEDTLRRALGALDSMQANMGGTEILVSASVSRGVLKDQGVQSHVPACG